jgi:protein-tyrosine-phosphatase
MFPGFGLGVSVLCHEGKILQAFEHHRAHEVNGSSYYRRSAPLNDERLGAVERMVAAVAYTGLAMFEFKSDPASGNWILIEVNARPWGSLPLPVSIGVDFPYRLFRLLVLKEITAQLDYPVGRYCRNLIGDMWQFRAAAARFLRQPHKFLEHCFKWLWSFHRIVLGREHHDTLVLDDLAPGLRELRDMFGSSGRSLLGKGISLKGPDLRLPQRLAQLAQGDAETLKVLFVCQGNINRSSYAELKSTQLLGSERLRFYSAGMLPRNRRSSPAMAVASASRHGVDMSAHQSRHVEAAMLEEADLVIAFDNEILRSVASRYPNMLGRIHLLGEADPEGELEIPDPEGQDEATYSAVYQRIDVCLTRLTEAVPIPSTDGISLC